MGRQSKIKTKELAYIAGFLNGDGSLILQLKKRKDTQIEKLKQDIQDIINL